MKIQPVGIRRAAPPAQMARVEHARATRDIQQAGSEVLAERTRKALDGEAHLGRTGSRLDVTA